VAVATHQTLTVRRQSRETVASALSWRRGMLLFHHATLADAVAELNRYNTEKIAVGDAYAANLTFNGALPTNDIAAFVRVTQKTFALHVARQGNEIVISR
jgi:transmembrane sensor